MSKPTDYKLGTIVEYDGVRGEVTHIEGLNHNVIRVKFIKEVYLSEYGHKDIQWHFGDLSRVPITNLKIISQPEDNMSDIKKELHKLVDNLDVEEFASKKIWFQGQSVHKLWIIKDFLKTYQKEPTLEDKLIEDGFAMSPSFINVFSKNNIALVIFNERKFIQIEVKGKDDKLICDINDHEQIFADIDYIEKRIK